jgi:hypothetical protein
MKPTRLRPTLAALIVAVPLLVMSQPAAAVPTQCEPDSAWIVITNIKKPYRLTHVRGYQSPPGGSKQISRTIASTSRIAAGVTAYGEGTVKVGKVLTEAEATAGVSLANNSETTTTGSVTVTDDLAASSKDRYYAGYVATRRFSGSWEKRRCNGSGTEYSRVAYGKWRSFRPNIYVEGIALCPASRYKTGSAPYKACKAAWS